MKFQKANLKNFEDCFTTHTAALSQGFEDYSFVPQNFLKKFQKDYPTYFKALLKSKLEMWLCLEEDKPAGVVIFGPFEDDETLGFVDSIYFLKKYHHTGLASKALEFAENKLKKHFKTIVLWCSKENARAWRFYEKHGYQPTQKTWDDDLDGKTFHNFLFEKKLLPRS